MKICLVEPPKYVSLTNPVSTTAMPPLGLAYVASALRSAGHEVSVVDAHGAGLAHYEPFGRMRLRGLEFDQIVERIPPDTELVGFGCMFSALWPVVRELIAVVHARRPTAHLVLGGEHGTALPELSLAQAPLTAVVMGEGEETAVEVAGALDRGTPLGEVPGIAYREDGVRVNAARARIAAVDDIAWPAWDLFDLEAYLRINQPHGAAQGRFIPMLATRGCPYSCTFCTSPQMWTTRWTPRSVSKLVDEMQHYYDTGGVRDFQFEDLTAIVLRKWILEFCAEVRRRDLRITFQLPSGTRSEVVDDEVAGALKSAGCHEFAFAPESGDARVLQAIRKKVKLENLFASARSALGAGINVGAFFIIGFPEDDWRSVLNTYRAIVRCAWTGFTNVNVNGYSPQPNTESFRRLSAQGVIGELDDDYLMSLFTFQDLGALKTSYNEHMSGLTVSILVVFGSLLFYVCYFASRPRRIVQLFHDLGSDKAANKTTKVAKAVLGDVTRILSQWLHSLRPT